MEYGRGALDRHSRVRDGARGGAGVARPRAARAPLGELLMLLFFVFAFEVYINRRYRTA